MTDLYKVMELADDSKWFVMARVSLNDIWYSYLIRLNDEEDDFLDEFMVVCTIIKDGKEFVKRVKDKEILNKVVPMLIPEVKAYMDNPKKVDELCI